MVIYGSSHSAPCCDLGLPIRPFGHMSPLVTCLACLLVPKSSLLPTRNFLSIAVSPFCSVPSTLLSQDSLPPIPHITCYCLPHSVSFLHLGQEEDCPSQSGRVPQLQALLLQRLLFFVVPGCVSSVSFWLSFMLCLSQSTAEVYHGLRLRTALWAISYTPISGDLISSSLKVTSSSTINHFFLWHLAFSLPKQQGYESPCALWSAGSWLTGSSPSTGDGGAALR